MVLRVDQEWLDNYQKKMGKKVPEKKPEPVKDAESPGYRSKLEDAFANLLSLCKRADRIKDWKYEPVKLKLYIKSVQVKGEEKKRGIYYIPDFMIFHNDGSIEFVETKGYLRKAAEHKYYIAVEKFNLCRWRMVKMGKGVWINMHINGEDILF